MELIMDRKYRKQGYTISNLYVDGLWFCNVLERTDRGLLASMPEESIKRLKVPGRTAIPAGRYRVELKIRSPRFSNSPAYAWCKGYLPRLMDVPGFDGVLIHAGNKASDSRGCLLVGFNTVRARLTSSMSTLECLYNKMEKAKGEIWLEIDGNNQCHGRATRSNCTKLNFVH